MKITVPGFVTEENVQEALRRCRMKNLSPNAASLAGAAIALGLLEQSKLGGDAGILAGTLSPADIATPETGDIDGALLPSLSQEQLEFIQADAASRGIDASELASAFKTLAPRMMKLISQHPKKEIEITLPDSGEV